MRSMHLGLSLVSFAHVINAQSCYAPDGSKLPQDNGFFSGMQPCTSGGPSTICCATNRTNPAGGNAANGDTKDECLPNGLCQNRKTKDGVESTNYFANFCTDSNWAGGNCLNICEQTRDRTGNTRMTSCNGRADSDRWCCGDSTACCGSGIGLVRLAQIFGSGAVSSAASSTTAPASSATVMRAVSSSPPSSVSSTLATSSASSSSSTPAVSSDPPTAPIPQSTNKKSSKLSPGAIAGIVIGTLALIALLAILTFFVRRANAHKKATAQAYSHPGVASAPVSEVHGFTSVPPTYNAGYVGEKYHQAAPVGAGLGGLRGGPYDGSAPAEMLQPPSELEEARSKAYPGVTHVMGTEAYGAPSSTYAPEKRG